MKTLPDNDNDLQLARKINESRLPGESLSKLQDPLIDELLVYKQSRLAEAEQFGIDKNEVWYAIKTQTQKSSQSSSNIFSMSNRKIWAAAAIILIATFLSLVYDQFYDRPVLLAQSDATIQSVQLNDGTEITLRPHSSLYQIQDNEKEKRVQLNGEGFFEVTSNPNRKFSVQTNHGVVTVLGTRFNVSTWSDYTQVFLEEGSVTVTTLKQKNTVTLKPGESASIDKTTGTPQVSTSNISEFTDWLNGQMIFDNKPISLIIQELQHHFNVSIELPKEVSQQTLSGRLSLKNLSTSLEDLGIVMGGTFQKTGDNTFTFDANQ